MRTIITILALCLGASATAQDTAFETAPSLTSLKQLDPELHQMLSDGTYDSMSADEQQSIVFDRLLRLSDHSPEVQLQIDLHYEREANRAGNVDTAVETMEARQLLGILQMIDSAVAAGPRRLVPEDVQEDAQ
jgi:hypothetical protein